MSNCMPCVCRSCGTAHTVQQLDLQHHDAGALHCPGCGAELIRWAGAYFYTLGVSPKKSSGEIPTLNLPPKT